eukprot:CAMPEP_0185770820 /NCGR_PEP_ID=MMETSP1174-20130828/61332_1 /TAXON_ID=35687 /ORGANISM="Dictyocha speculum, Strain CCMP1381" /LENGTH=107 /DNA_ID=CAMNT_0028456419 /DNA_START=96 /DNA_END=419 /DNA_ORIENTATION=+
MLHHATKASNSRRAFMAGGIVGAILTTSRASEAIDINNAISGDFQAYKGLFPTISAKVIQRGPFKNPEELYAAMDSDIERERLKQYEKEFTFNKKEGGDRGSGKRNV